MDDFNKDDTRDVVYKLLNKKLDAAHASVMLHGAGYLNVDSNGVKHIPIADVTLDKGEEETMSFQDDFKKDLRELLNKYNVEIYEDFHTPRQQSEFSFVAYDETDSDVCYSVNVLINKKLIDYMGEK